VVEVPLAHPRNRSDAAFVRIRDDVLREFAEPETPTEAPPLPAASDLATPITPWRMAW
jgi:sulfonate transport system ATP-binding protein